MVLTDCSSIISRHAALAACQKPQLLYHLATLFVVYADNDFLKACCSISIHATIDVNGETYFAEFRP